MNDAQGAAAPAAFRLSGPLVARVTWVGITAALAGLITGLLMALQRRVVVCPEGAFFPEGTTDFRCFEHPLALEGAAVLAIAIALGALIVLAALTITTLRRPDTSPTE